MNAPCIIVVYYHVTVKQHTKYDYEKTVVCVTSRLKVIDVLLKYECYRMILTLPSGALINHRHWMLFGYAFLSYPGDWRVPVSVITLMVLPSSQTATIWPVYKTCNVR